MKYIVEPNERKVRAYCFGPSGCTCPSNCTNNCSHVCPVECAVYVPSDKADAAINKPIPK